LPGIPEDMPKINLVRISVDWYPSFIKQSCPPTPILYSFTPR